MHKTILVRLQADNFPFPPGIILTCKNLSIMAMVRYRVSWSRWKRRWTWTSQSTRIARMRPDNSPPSRYFWLTGYFSCKSRRCQYLGILFELISIQVGPQNCTLCSEPAETFGLNEPDRTITNRKEIYTATLLPFYSGNFNSAFQTPFWLNSHHRNTVEPFGSHFFKPTNPGTFWFPLFQTYKFPRLF